MAGQLPGSLNDAEALREHRLLQANLYLETLLKVIIFNKHTIPELIRMSPDIMQK
jgi:hypothetical protein